MIPAAGRGARMGGKRKQLRCLGNAPLLRQTVLAFDRHPEIHHIIVVAPVDALKDVKAMLSGLEKLAGIVAGGVTRQKSVSNGIEALPDATDIVLVHDAARPFIDADVIANTIRAVARYGAAAVAVPVTDTVRYGREHVFMDSISRDNLYAMQTPQGFRRQMLEENVYMRAEHACTTDDVAIVQGQGWPVHIVDGRSHNIKITTPEDWILAEQMWPYFARARTKDE